MAATAARAGSTAASSLLAGNVFLATANPATLMTIGTGVGSAVMGPTGIVAAAPFVAASGALIPVVAPVMLFMTVSSVVLSARIELAQRTLGRMEEVVDRVRRFRDEDDCAQFDTAAQRIDQIRSEFERCHRFASNVQSKLAIVEDEVIRLRARYGGRMTEDVGDVGSEDDALSAVSDLKRFFLASLYDIQVDLLQMYLALQNDPDVVKDRQSQLRGKIKQYRDDFRQLLADDRIGAYHRSLKGDLGKSMWSYLPRAVRRRVGGALDRRVRRIRDIRRDFYSVQALIRQWVDAYESVADESRRQSIIVYRESDAERELRVVRTRDVRLEQAPA